MDFTIIFTPETIKKILFSLVGIIIFFAIYRIVNQILKKTLYPKIKENTSFLVKKFLKYTFFILLITYILNLFNIKLTALFGALGIAGVAVGFAAQTSVSNIISGLFLLTEHAFKVGDYISIGDEAGTIDSIGMLSIKIHTPDNQYIRIPNETIIKSNLKNNSYFEIRRFSLKVSVAYKTDLKKLIEILETIPQSCSYSLKEPSPKVFIENFGSSGIELTLTSWSKKENYMELKNQLFIAVKETFEKNNIEIPYNKVVILDDERNEN